MTCLSVFGFNATTIVYNTVLGWHSIISSASMFGIRTCLHPRIANNTWLNHRASWLMAVHHGCLIMVKNWVYAIAFLYERRYEQSAQAKWFSTHKRPAFFTRTKKCCPLHVGSKFVSMHQWTKIEMPIVKNCHTWSSPSFTFLDAKPNAKPRGMALNSASHWKYPNHFLKC